MSLVLAALLGVFVLLMVAATGNWSLLGIAPGLRLQLFGQGTVAYDALTPSSRSFGSRDFRVREGDTVLVSYDLTGAKGSARLGVALCTRHWLRVNCEMLLFEPIALPAKGQAEVAIPVRGRCSADLWVRDYTGGLTLRWERRAALPTPTP